MRKKSNLASKMIQNATVSRSHGHKIGKESLKKAIRASGGIISDIARRFGCPNDRSKVYRAIYKYGLEEDLQEEREILLDMAESRLVKAMMNGDEKAALRILFTFGRSRGWSLTR